MEIDPAFEDLYARERRAVFATVFLLSRDRQAAEDATQEALWRLDLHVPPTGSADAPVHGLTPAPPRPSG